MSQAYTHHWDEIEYFKLAVPHAEKDSVVAGVKAGCNGCHAPIAFLAGDVPPLTPGTISAAPMQKPRIRLIRSGCIICRIQSGQSPAPAHQASRVGRAVEAGRGRASGR